MWVGTHPPATMACPCNKVAWCGNLGEAYTTLLKHQKSDTKKFKIFNYLGFGLLFATAIFHASDYFWMLIVVGSAWVVQGLIVFIDMSNRNSMLHMIDYIEWRKRHPD